MSGGRKIDTDASVFPEDQALANALLDSILGLTTDAIVVIDARQSIRVFSKGAEIIFGYSAEEAIGQPLEMLLPARLKEFHNAHIEDFANSPETRRSAISRQPLVGIRRDGTEILAEASVAKLDLGNETAFAVFLRDVTAREETENALRQREAQLQSVFDNSPFEINLKDLDGRYLLFSKHFNEFFGTKADQALGKLPSDIFSAEFAKAVEDHDRAVIETKKAVEREIEVPEEDGVHTYAVIKFPIREESGNITGIGALANDITERKRTEDSLKASEARLVDAIESISEGFVLFDADECFVLCNSKYRDFYSDVADLLIPGMTLGEIARTAYEVGAFREVPAIEGDWLATRLKQIHEAKGTHEQLLRDGRWLLCSERHTSDGGLVGIRTDITKHRQAEDAVQTRDLWLRGILENAPIQIVIKDIEGRVMAISRNVVENFGMTEKDFIGRTTTDFLPKEIAELYMAADRRVMENGQPIQQDVTEEIDGKTEHYLNAKFPLKDDDGRIVGICSLTSDITELKQAEERLRQAQKMEALGQLTGGIAHDFNNLLAVILGNAEILEERAETPDKSVSAMIRAAERGAELTQRLLAFSRRQPLQPKQIDLGQLTHSMSQMLQRSLGELVEIEIKTAPDLWTAQVDSSQVENAILNLAINARDAMPKGGKLIIETTNVSLDDAYAANHVEVNSGDYVLLSVSDTGTGIAPNKLKQVFEPFFTTKDVGKGTGLGLSMVYGFAKQSGGDVAIYSEAGHGTTVKLYLPRGCGAADDDIEDKSLAVPGGQGESLLVIEDDPDIRALAETMLTDLGYQVLVAEDARAGLAVIEKTPEINLILSDVVLPGGMSGPALAKQAKQLRPNIKFLFMSGYAEGVIRDQTPVPDDAILLNKPFHKHNLAQSVRATLDR